MPFIPVPGVIQAELVYAWDGQVVENVLHYTVDAEVDVAAQQGLGGALVDWFDTLLQPLVPSTLILNEVRLSNLSSEFAPGASWTGGLPLPGTLAGGLSLPNNVALTMTKRTDMRGRSFRGRIYHPGLSESQVTGNAIVSGTLVSLLAAYNAMKTLTAGSLNYQLVVVSRFQGGEPRAEGIATEVTTITSDGIIDSQRRRLPGRGS